MIARLRTVSTGLLLTLIIMGCGSNVTLDPPTIPEPLISPLPMTVGLRLPENFEAFVHTEEVLGREEWKIDLGRSNAVFFDQLFGYMFKQVKRLDADDDPSVLALDALIEPSIDAFEFSVPNQTKTDAFAVWIRYRIKVFDRSGKMVANWPVSAYGKSLTTTMGGSDALQRAAVLAMRDAAALLIMKFGEKELLTSLAGDSSQLPEISETVDENETATAQATTVDGGSNE